MSVAQFLREGESGVYGRASFVSDLDPKLASLLLFSKGSMAYPMIPFTVLGMFFGF